MCTLRITLEPLKESNEYSPNCCNIYYSFTFNPSPLKPVGITHGYIFAIFYCIEALFTGGIHYFVPTRLLVLPLVEYSLTLDSKRQPLIFSFSRRLALPCLAPLPASAAPPGGRQRRRKQSVAGPFLNEAPSRRSVVRLKPRGNTKC